MNLGPGYRLLAQPRQHIPDEASMSAGRDAAEVVGVIGSPGWARTSDFLINRRAGDEPALSLSPQFRATARCRSNSRPSPQELSGTLGALRTEIGVSHGCVQRKSAQAQKPPPPSVDEPPCAPNLSPQRERSLELGPNLRSRLRAPARTQHHAQHAVDAEPRVPEAGVVQPRLAATRAANHLRYLFVASGLCPRPLAPYHYGEVLIDRIGRYVNLERA